MSLLKWIVVLVRKWQGGVDEVTRVDVVRRENIAEVRRRLSNRYLLSDREFIVRAGFPFEKLPEGLVKIIRERLEAVAKMPLGSVYPDDAFDGEFGLLLDWPEFEISIDLSGIAQLGLKLDARKLDKIVDPSTAGRRGTVRDLVKEFLRAIGDV